MTVELDFFGPEARFHHVGLAVRSIPGAEPRAESVVDPIQRVAVTFLELNGLTVELIEPHGEGSPIDRSLRNGTKLLHLCYEVPDLDVALERCREFGLHRLGEPVPATAFDGRRIVWVYCAQYGLFELLESGNPEPRTPS